ncbi:hypothetical protein ACTFIW_003607 [Dictyostelium discoideum]
MSGDFSNIYNISSSITISPIDTSICNEINFSCKKSQIICTIGAGKSNQQIKLSDGNGATLINDEFYYRVPFIIEIKQRENIDYDTDDYYHEYSIPHWVIVIPKRFKCGSGSGSSSITNARLKKLSTLLVISTASSLLQYSIHHRHKKLLTLFVIKTVLSLFQISIYKRHKKLLTLFVIKIFRKEKKMRRSTISTSTPSQTQTQASQNNSDKEKGKVKEAN